MIAGLKGLVEDAGADWVQINVGGVVFRLHASSSTLSAMPQPGTPVNLHTHLQVREDELTLFGFSTKAELRMFQLLITVTGVGPRIALALLSAMSTDDLVLALASEDTARLSGVTGVGKRTAARLILELKGKVGQFEAATSTAATGSTAQLLAVLNSLGYSSAEAASAIRSIPNLPALDLEEGIREALRVLSSRK